MIKKILMVGLWTAVLTFCSLFITVLLCVAYLRVTLHGARPSEHTHETMVTLWTSVPGIVAPIALSIGVFGFLPGTRRPANSPNPSEWTKWIYRLCVAVALFAMPVSFFWDNIVSDVLATAAPLFALGVALIDKYARKQHQIDF
jgi:hypothetical protein